MSLVCAGFVLVVLVVAPVLRGAVSGAVDVVIFDPVVIPCDLDAGGVALSLVSGWGWTGRNAVGSVIKARDGCQSICISWPLVGGVVWWSSASSIGSWLVWRASSPLRWDDWSSSACRCELCGRPRSGVVLFLSTPRGVAFVWVV